MLRKIVIPPLIPLLVTCLWIYDKIAESGLDWHIAFGMFFLTTILPIIFSIWYGWELKKEFNNANTK